MAAARTPPAPQGMDFSPEQINAWFDADQGLVDKRIYVDPDIYELELERVFARAWHFMCHESHLKQSGDYLISHIGEDAVIVVRDDAGAIQVMLNVCSHRGNVLCRSEMGRTHSFQCSYHGWNFSLDGKLFAVPGHEPFYRCKLERERWGLTKAAKVEQYKGFYFATFDADAPPLHEFLGEVGRLGIDQMTAHGELEAVDGIQKNIIECNWKIAVDNLYDWYHVNVTHRSAMRVGFVNASVMQPMQQMVMLGEYGHAISGPGISVEQQQVIDELPDAERTRLDGLSFDERAKLAPRLTERRPIRHSHMREVMGPVGVRAMGHPNIFPNLWVSTRALQLSLRIPRGPLRTEVWWFSFLPKSYSDAQKRAAQKFMAHSFGPAGLLEQDDGENWTYCTQTALGRVSRRRAQNLQMALGEDQVRVDPSGQRSIESPVNEHAQRWHYRCWQDWLRAGSWDELRRNHSAVPSGRV
jgi:phenylpropionate dioxygenase-like ring-hydroxylating dioxygenase large terminal subunit